MGEMLGTGGFGWGKIVEKGIFGKAEHEYGVKTRIRSTNISPLVHKLGIKGSTKCATNEHHIWNQHIK